MNESLWINTSAGDRSKVLTEDITTKCLIVGGGIAGITTAYLLAKKGVAVTVVDADYIGYGASGRNTGKITAQHGNIYSKIYRTYGLECAKEYYEANRDAIVLIEKIIAENNIECDYERVPSYIFTERDEESKNILEEFNICKELGIECEFTMELPVPIDIKGAIKFDFAAQFNPKKYIDSLLRRVIELGGSIYEKTPIKSLEIGEDNIKVCSLGNLIIKAEKLIITSHFPFYDGLSFYFTRLKPERSYIVAGEYKEQFPKATFINLEKPTRSFRVYNDGERNWLLIGGESHKVAHKNDIEYYEKLKSYGNDIFKLDKYSFQWSAQDYIPPDNIPYIGYLNTIKEKIFVATGFSKWGMTNGTVAARILSDIYFTGKSKYLNIFNPSRTEGYFTAEFLKENIDIGVQYIIGKLHIANADMPSRGKAKIAIIDKKKYGVYRDEKDGLHIIDVMCTHLGCELKWNPLERSWDCPCHGSRFGIDGDILEGPATIPLKEYGSDTYNEIHPNLL